MPLNIKATPRRNAGCGSGNLVLSDWETEFGALLQELRSFACRKMYTISVRVRQWKTLCGSMDSEQCVRRAYFAASTCLKAIGDEPTGNGSQSTHAPFHIESCLLFLFGRWRRRGCTDMTTVRGEEEEGYLHHILDTHCVSAHCARFVWSRLR